MKRPIKLEIERYLMMILACFLYAFGFCFFIHTNEIVAGGLTGLGIIFEHFIPQIAVGTWVIILNIPMLIVAFFQEGKKFTINCLITVLVLNLSINGLTALMNKFNWSIDLSDINLGALPHAIFGGLFQGISIGLFCRYRCSSGGTELLGRFFHEWSNQRVSIPVFNGICDTIIVLLGLTFKGVSNLFYALIVIFITMKVSDIVILGFNSSKLCYVITTEGEKVGQYLVHNSPRGVTLLEGKGMYTGNPREVLITVVKKNQLPHLKEMILSQDPNAFMIVSETNEVLGNGFKKLAIKDED